MSVGFRQDESVADVRISHLEERMQAHEDHCEQRSERVDLRMRALERGLWTGFGVVVTVQFCIVALLMAWAAK